MVVRPRTRPKKPKPNPYKTAGGFSAGNVGSTRPRPERVKISNDDRIAQNARRTPAVTLAGGYMFSEGRLVGPGDDQ